MCSIYGFYCVDPNLDVSKQFVLQDLLNSINARSQERGRDSVGWAVRYRGGNVVSRRVPSPAQERPKWRLAEGEVPWMGIANNRGEPTTEFVQFKKQSDVQPYQHGTVWAVHNGTIHNDTDLYNGWAPPTKIDSYAIPWHISNGGDVQDFVGSYALALWDTQWFHLTLARNWQPLSLYWLPILQTYIFVSLPEYFEEAAEELTWKPIPFPPYTKLILDDFYVSRKDIGPPVPDTAAVIISGGLDSTTVAKIAANRHRKVHLIHYAYGCRAEASEIRSVRMICEQLQNDHPDKDITLSIQRVDFLKNLGGSTLLDEDSPIASGNDGAEYAYEWVPARNTVLVAMTAAFCDRYDVGHIYMGLNLEEAGAYGDNTEEFYRQFNNVLAVGTRSRAKIVNPLASRMKHEIVSLAYEVEAPIRLSWSCYQGGAQHCGKCGPCYMRRQAFRMNGIPDSVSYEEE